MLEIQLMYVSSLSLCVVQLVSVMVMIECPKLIPIMCVIDLVYPRFVMMHHRQLVPLM